MPLMAQHNMCSVPKMILFQDSDWKLYRLLRCS